MKKIKLIASALLVGMLTVGQVFGQHTKETTLLLGKTEAYLSQIKVALQTAQGARKASPGIEVKVSSHKTLRLIPLVNQTDAIQDFTLIGNIDGYKWANFAIRSTNGEVSGQIIIHDTKEAYKYASDANGNITVTATPIDKVICVDYATDMPAEEKVQPSGNRSASRTAALDLQSLPGAGGCIFLDFDGHYVVNTNWEGGAAINSAASGMSDAQVQEVFEIISEDFRPFNLNITTNESVYNSYAQNRRMRCVFTPSNFTDKGSGGAGGVAFLNSFNWNNNDPCYVFMTGGAKAPAEGASHEIGHTLGLSHDGLTNPVKGYYEGHGNWAPIMGVGYYRPISQWSKGEYNYADQKQDDLAIIAGNGGVGYRADQHGNTTATAASLNINANGTVVANNNYGIIERTGDVDMFRFSTGGGNVTLNVNTVNRHGDLDIIIRLYNNSGTEINSSNPSGLNASINTSLAAGTYYLSVSGTGADNPATNGYSNYASLGSYWVSGTVPSPGTNPSPSTGLVTVYADINYGGFYGGLSTGDYTLAQLQALGVKDNDITSLKVAEGYKAILFFDNNFTGKQMTVTANTSWIGAEFNDQVSSIRVLPNGITDLAGTYFIRNNVSGLFMDLRGSSADNGAVIQQYGYNGTEAQKFELVHLGNGNYTIKSAESSKVLDVVGISQEEGALVNQWTNGNGKNQHFIFFDAGNGLVKIIAEHSGQVLRVSTNNASEQLHQWTNTGQANSFWRLMPANQKGVVAVYTDCNYQGFRVALGTGEYTLAQLYDKGFTDNTLSSMQVPEGFKVILYMDDNFTGTSITMTNDVPCYSATWNDKVTSLKVIPNGNPGLAGTYYLKNSESGFTLDLDNSKPDNGAAIRQWTYNGTNAQKFKFEHLGDGNYTVVQVASNKVLDVLGLSYTAGTRITQWESANGKNQHFILVAAGNGLFKMISEHSALVADVPDNTRGAELRQWNNTGQAASKWLFTPVDQVIGTGNGLRANYFNGQNFETPVYTALDSKIDFTWNNGSPNAAVNNDGFSARWTGQVQAKSTGTYTFYINSDNGRRLWVNNQLIIDKWLDDHGTEYSGTVALVAGQKYDIKMEYFENNGTAEAHLSWSTIVLPKEIVPQTQLYANALPTVSITAPANNATYVAAANVDIAVNAADTDGSVAKVEFYNGAVKLGEDLTSPFSYNWTNVAVGSYTITARAIDNRGAIAVSSLITIKVNANQNPLVSVSAVSPSPNTVTITATATDADGSITKVDYYNGTTKVGTSTTSPYTTTLTGVTAGTHSITAVATDDKGGTATSSAVTVTVVNPNEAPTVSITAPDDNAIYVAAADIKLTATANDADGSVDKVEFYNGTTLLGTSTDSPYIYDWTNVAAGTYNITAKAYDNLGLSTTSTPITVKVNENEKPLVSVDASSPSANTIVISATASDSDGSITKVEYYDGAVKIGESTSSPYSFTWTNVPAGSHSITAVAIDDKGGQTTSSAVTVNVSDPNKAPVVSIITPVDGAAFNAPATISITADAKDQDGTIAKVEFYNGATLLGTVNTSPYIFSWEDVRAGSYTITVKAYDNVNAATVSEPVNVVVNIVTTDIVDPQTNADYLTIYPNPAESNLYIGTSKDLSAAKVEIFDAHGRLVSAPVLHDKTLYVGDLEAGFYIIEITNLNDRYIQRFIKQ